MSSISVSNFHLGHVNKNIDCDVTLSTNEHKNYFGETVSDIYLTFKFDAGYSVEDETLNLHYEHGYDGYDWEMNHVDFFVREIVLDLENVLSDTTYLSALGKDHAENDWKYDDWTLETHHLWELDSNYLASVLTLEDLDIPAIINDFLNYESFDAEERNYYISDGVFSFSEVDDSSIASITLEFADTFAGDWVKDFLSGDAFYYEVYTLDTQTYDTEMIESYADDNEAREAMYKSITDAFEHGATPEEYEGFEYCAYVNIVLYLENGHGEIDDEELYSEHYYMLDEYDVERLYKKWVESSSPDYDIDDEDYED